MILAYGRENGPALPLLLEEEVMQVIKRLKTNVSIIIITHHMRVSPSQNFSRSPIGAPPASAGFSTSFQ